MHQINVLKNEILNHLSNRPDSNFYAEESRDFFNKYEKSSSYRRNILPFEDYVFPLADIMYSKEDASTVLKALLLENKEDTGKLEELYPIFEPSVQIFLDTQLDNEFLKKVKELNKADFQALFDIVITKQTIKVTEIAEYLGCNEKDLGYHQIHSFEVINIDSHLMFIPNYTELNFKNNFIRFTYLNTLLQSEYFILVCQNEKLFNRSLHLYLDSIHSIINRDQIREKNTLINLLYDSVLAFVSNLEHKHVDQKILKKQVILMKLINLYKVHSAIGNFTIKKNYEAVKIANLDIPTPGSGLYLLNELEKIYDDVQQKEQDFIDIILFNYVLYIKDYDNAVKIGEKLYHHDALVDNLLAFRASYPNARLDLRDESEIVRIENNHIKATLAWGLIDSYMALQDFDKAADLLLKGEVYPIPLLKLYNQRHALSVDYQPAPLNKALQAYFEDTLRIIKETEEKHDDKNKVKDFIRETVYHAGQVDYKILKDLKQINLTDQHLQKVILHARLLYDNNPSLSWDKTEAAHRLTNDIKNLLRFQIEAEIELALGNSDRSVLQRTTIIDLNSRELPDHQQRIIGDFAHRLSQMIKIFIVKEEYELATLFMEIFKDIFYSFYEELISLSSFYKNLLAKKGKIIEVSMIEMMEEVRDLTRGIKSIPQKEKDRLEEQIYQIHVLYAKVGESAHSLYKGIKDEVIYTYFSKLNEEERKKLDEKIMEKWQEKYAEYPIKDNLHTRIKDELMELIHEDNWEKLHPNTQSFLISGKIIYKEIEPIPDSFNIDFSGPIIPLCAAVENELKTKIFSPYKRHYQNLYNEKKNKKQQSEFMKNKVPFGLKYNNTFSKDNFLTIGSLNILAGYDTKTKIVKFHKEKELFMNFCKKIFTYKNEADLEDFLYGDKGLIKLVDKLRVNHRNEAAHTAYLPKTTVEECLELVLTTEKIIELLAVRYK